MARVTSLRRGGRRPPRGYSWPPFAPGNTAAARHGAHSESLIAPLQSDLVEQAVNQLPYLAALEYVPAVQAWARAEARCELVHRYLDREGLLDDRGRPRPAAELAIRLERVAMEHRDRLGLSPLARARLGRDIAGTGVDLARLWSAQSGAQGHEPSAAEPGPSRADAVPARPVLPEVPEV